MAKFQIGKVYLTAGYIKFPYLCVRRTEKSVWFCDLNIPEDIFRRTSDGFICNANMPENMYNNTITSNVAYDFEKYCNRIVNRKDKIQIINHINKVCGDNLLDKDGHLGWWVEKSWKRM